MNLGGEWKTLGELKPGSLFELTNGTTFGVTHAGPRLPTPYCPVVLIRDKSLSPIGLDKDLVAREIDLPFLLMVAADRLEENQAYQRGLQDGIDQERHAAAKFVEKFDEED